MCIALFEPSISLQYIADSIVVIFCFNFVHLSCEWLRFVSPVFEIKEDIVQYDSSCNMLFANRFPNALFSFLADTTTSTEIENEKRVYRDVCGDDELGTCEDQPTISVN